MKILKRDYFMVNARLLKVLPVTISILATVFLSSCTLMPKEEEVLAPPIKEPQKVTYETIEVKKANIEKKIQRTGNFVSVSQKELFFQYRGGRIKDIYFKYGDNVKKGDLLAELETDPITDDIAMQQLAVRKSQISYEKIKTQTSVEGGGGKYELELAELDLNMEKLKLESLYKELDKSKIISPIDGEVVYVSDVKKGDNVNAYDIIIIVADPKVLELQYSQDRISDFSLGMKVDVEIDKEHYTGKIAATPSEAPKDADEKAKNSIWITVDKLPDSVEIGSDAIFSLTLEKRENVIVLPKQVVNTFVGRKFVNVLKNGIREERDVELGVQTDTEVEVIKGLDVGEQVIIR